MWLLILWILFAVFSAALAGAKHRSQIGWGLVGLLFGPFGLLVAFFPALLDEGSRGVPDSVRNQHDGKRRACPACRESILFSARVCKHCGLRYPYLPESARTHVAAIADLHGNGRSTDQIIANLEERGIHPSGSPAWTVDLVEEILHDHITDASADDRSTTQMQSAPLPAGNTEAGSADPPKRAVPVPAGFGFIAAIIGLIALIAAFGGKDCAPQSTGASSSSSAVGANSRTHASSSEAEESSQLATSADEAARRELMMTAWIHDTYVSPGHMNVGVLVDEKDWQMPMIGKWVCGVLSKHRSYLTSEASPQI